MRTQARNWVAFSSASGQTFHNVWRALNPHTQNSFVGFFVDRPCSALGLAKEFLDPKKIFDFSSPTKEAFENSYTSWEEQNHFSEAPLIFLIGYFRLVSAQFLNRGSPVINTHPSLLPAFPGLDKKVHEAAFENSLVSGFSVHLVNEKMDAGPLVFQKAIANQLCQNAEEVRDKVREVEQKYLPQVIDQLVMTNLSAEDRHLSSRQLQKVKGFPLTCVD